MADADHMHVRLAGETRPFDVRIEPGADWTADLARRLDVVSIRKLRLVATLSPDGAADWRLEGTLGATVVQPCVVTLAPVTTRIDVPVSRRYVANLPEPEPGAETEMPEDDSVDALPATLDLGDLAAEALALALPDFPRAEGVDPIEMTVTEPGAAPMTDEDTKPFAGLAGLRDKLSGEDGGEG